MSQASLRTFIHYFIVKLKVLFRVRSRFSSRNQEMFIAQNRDQSYTQKFISLFHSPCFKVEHLHAGVDVDAADIPHGVVDPLPGEQVVRVKPAPRRLGHEAGGRPLGLHGHGHQILTTDSSPHKSLPHTYFSLLYSHSAPENVTCNRFLFSLKIN